MPSRRALFDFFGQILPKYTIALNTSKATKGTCRRRTDLLFRKTSLANDYLPKWVENLIFGYHNNNTFSLSQLFQVLVDSLIF